MSRLRAVVALAGLVGTTGAFAVEPETCIGDPALAALDFWVGDWDVCAEGRLAGHDRVDRILGGCAVTEAWTGADGARGNSLFYYEASEKQWKQVWVTDRALHPGGLKEKRLIASFADGGVRFQGAIALPDGRRILDRTTLRPIDSHAVSQLIEISRDGGEHWTASFDAVYRPVGAAGAASPANCR